MSILQMTLSGAVMIIVIVIIRALTVRTLPKRTFTVMWYIALARLLIPYSIPCAFSVWSLLQEPPKEQIVPQAAVTEFTQITPTFTETAPNVTIEAPPVTETVASADPREIVWIIGISALAVFFAVTYLKSLKIFRESLPADNGFTRSWLSEHKLLRRVSIRYSDRVSSPLTYGIIRPVILLPKNFDGNSADDLNYVLTHEYVHIRRFDAAFKLLLTAAVCVHWFNPMVWVMYVIANHDIELACDEAVIRSTGGAVSDYAMALIRMEEQKSGLTLINNFSKNSVKERIVSIMKYKKLTPIAAAVASCLVIGTTTVFATSAKNESPEKLSPTNAVPKFEQTELGEIEYVKTFSSWSEAAEKLGLSLAPCMTDPHGAAYYNRLPNYSILQSALGEGTDGTVGLIPADDVKTEPVHIESITVYVPNNRIMNPDYKTDTDELYSYFKDFYTIAPPSGFEFDPEFVETHHIDALARDADFYLMNSNLFALVEYNGCLFELSYGDISGRNVKDAIIEACGKDNWRSVDAAVNVTPHGNNNASVQETGESSVAADSSEQLSNGFISTSAPEVEWWTYDEYAAWLEQEKKDLQSIIGNRGWTPSRGDFVWDQALVDETIAMYEKILQEIKNGVKVSKSVDGSDDVMLATGTGESPAAASDFSEYKKFGLEWNETDDVLYYNGKRVRYFFDGADMGDGALAVKIEYADKEKKGEIDVHAVRERIENSDGSFNPMGPLTGLEPYSQEEYNARTFIPSTLSAVTYGDAEVFEGNTATAVVTASDDIEISETAVAEGTGGGTSFEEIFAKYKNYGITYVEDKNSSGRGNVYYNGQLVRKFSDISPDGHAFSFTSSKEGEINVQTIYADGKLSGIAIR